MSLQAFNPRPSQRSIIERIARNTFIQMHRRAGKSYLLTWLCARQLMIPMADRTILYVAPYLKQVRQTCWNYFREHLHGASHIKFKSSEHTIENTLTRSRIILSGMKDQTADSLRGLGAHFVVADELSGYTHDDYHSILLPIVAETRGTTVLSGTPPPTFDLFVEQKILHQQEAVSRPELYAFHSYNIHETDVFDAEEIDEFRRRSPASFPREYELDTETGDETTFAPISLLEQLTMRDPDEADADEPSTCGWDVALKRDNSAYVIRQDHQIVAMGRLRGSPSEQTAALYRVMNKHVCRILAFDRGGLGHAFDEPIDRLCERDIYLDTYNVSFQSRASDPSKFANTRSEIYYRLQSWLHLPYSTLPPAHHPVLAEHAPTLLEDIAAQQTRLNDKNQFAMEHKDVIKKAIGRSPDFSDALALSFIAVDPADPYDRTYQEVQDTTKMPPAEIMDRWPELYPERWRT